MNNFGPKQDDESNEILDVRKYPHQLKKFSNEIFLLMHQDLKSLQEFMNDIIENEDEYDFINIGGIFDFYSQYVLTAQCTFVDFDDYVLSYMQDKSEFAAKQLLERIWNECNNVLELYYDNKSVFDKYDSKGFVNLAMQTAYYTEYHSILQNLRKALPTPLREFFYEDKPIVDLPLTVIETIMEEFTSNMKEVQEEINREVRSLDDLLEIIRRTQVCPRVFSDCMETLIEYVDTIATFIGKESYQKRLVDRKKSIFEEIPPFVIEGELLDDLYDLCNSTVVFSCTKSDFNNIINGKRPDGDDIFRHRDICRYNKAYHLINQMSLVIPHEQYKQWRDKLLEAQHIKRDVYNKKWSSITSRQTKENAEFIKKVQKIVDKHRLK